MAFKSKEEAFKENTRQGFINRICEKVWRVHNGNLAKILKSEQLLFEEIKEFVRNSYELVDEYLPLIWYCELKIHGADVFDYTEDEYNGQLNDCMLACIEYYSL